jgi:hypothetical protein
MGINTVFSDANHAAYFNAWVMSSFSSSGAKRRAQGE